MTHMQAKIEVKGQMVQNPQWKQTEWRTQPIALPSPITRSAKIQSRSNDVGEHNNRTTTLSLRQTKIKPGKSVDLRHHRVCLHLPMNDVRRRSTASNCWIRQEPSNPHADSSSTQYPRLDDISVCTRFNNVGGSSISSHHSRLSSSSMHINTCQAHGTWQCTALFDCQPESQAVLRSNRTDRAAWCGDMRGADPLSRALWSATLGLGTRKASLYNWPRP